MRVVRHFGTVLSAHQVYHIFLKKETRRSQGTYIRLQALELCKDCDCTGDIGVFTAPLIPFAVRLCAYRLVDMPAYEVTVRARRPQLQCPVLPRESSGTSWDPWDIYGTFFDSLTSRNGPQNRGRSTPVRSATEATVSSVFERIDCSW